MIIQHLTVCARASQVACFVTDTNTGRVATVFTEPETVIGTRSATS